MLFIRPNKALTISTFSMGLCEYNEIDAEFKHQLIKPGYACYSWDPISITVKVLLFNIELQLKRGWEIDFIQDGIFREKVGFSERNNNKEYSVSDFRPNLQPINEQKRNLC